MSLTPNEKDLLAKKSDLEGILKPDANDILHLPDITISLAENQQGYTTSGLSKDGLVFAGAGTITGITSSDGNSATLAASQSAVSAKQDKLIAGSNITIAQDGKTISATDTNEIENLTDVDITNLANGQILKYNSTSQKWENGNESGGGSSTLAGLSDVDITSPSAGQGLVYDATNQEWVNGNVSTSSSIDTLTDVNLTNLSNGQILKYNSTSQEWENTNESGGSSTRHYLGQLIERVSSADSHITASTSNASYADWGAFNGTNPTNLSSPEANSCWLPVVDQTNQWIQYHFDEERYFTKIGINCFSNYGSAWVGTIKVEGSTDGTNWTNVLASGSTYQLTANLQALTAVEVDLDDTDTWTYIKVTFVEKMSIAYQPSCFINEVYVYGGELQAIPENIEDLQNVNITSPSDGQVLIYDNTSGKWVNDTPTASSSISTLTDVNLTSLSDGQILKYDATNQEWVNADESGGGGGTSKYTEEVLWSGNESTSRWAEPIVLNIDITDYDMLSIRCGASNETGGVHIILTSEIPSGDSSGGGTVSLGTFTDSQYSIWLNKDNNILRIFTSTGVYISVKEVVGIKYGSGGGGGSGDSFITYTKTVTTTNYGWWTVEDKDGNALDPDEYIIVDISVNARYYDVLWYQDSAGDYKATLININDVYEIRSSTTYDWTITYAKKDFSGGGGAGAEEISLPDYNALTTAEKNDGTIRFIPENPYGIITDVDMSTITNLSENKITVTPSADEIEIDFDHNAGNSIGGTFYISAPVDVTNYDYLKYDLATGVCYNSLHSDTNPGRNLGIGLCRNAPSSWQLCPNVSWEVSNIYDVNDVNLTFTDEIIDVSALTGQYYFVLAFVAWEATISNLKLATAGGYSSQIKYMSKTYADGTGGGGGGGIDYSTTEHIVGTWIDDSPLYEKTIDIIKSSSVAATRDVSLSNDIPANARVIEAKGMYEYIYGNKKYGFPIGVQYVYGVLENSEYLLRIVLGNGSLQSDEAIITVRYTKSN